MTRSYCFSPVVVQRCGGLGRRQIDRRSVHPLLVAALSGGSEGLALAATLSAAPWQPSVLDCGA